MVMYWLLFFHRLFSLLFFSFYLYCIFFFFFSSRRRHTRCGRDWSSDVCSSDLGEEVAVAPKGFVCLRGVVTSCPSLLPGLCFLVEGLSTSEEDLRFPLRLLIETDRKSTRLNSSHVRISYAVFCLKKKTKVQSIS